MSNSEILVNLNLERDPSCARRARAVIAETFPQDPRCDSLEVIVSELVINALEHGDGDIHLAVLRTNDTLRVEISNDTDQTESELDLDMVGVPPAIDSERGRGLSLVKSFSNEIGYYLINSRLTVWAEL